MTVSRDHDRAFQRLRRWRRLMPLMRLTGKVYIKELLFQGIVDQAARALKLDSAPLYPVSSAANYSLLYCILRLVDEAGCRRVLEIGAGQSSLLLDALARSRAGLSIRSIESDAAWIDGIGARVSQTIDHCPLEDREVLGRRTRAFAGADRYDGADFDLVIVDGPVGAPRYSRWGALELLLGGLAEEFVVLFDDAERPGEQDTIRAFIDRVSRPVEVHPVFAAKCQMLVYTPRYHHLRYF